MANVSSEYSNLPHDNLKMIANYAYMGGGVCKRWQSASKDVEDVYFSRLFNIITTMIPAQLGGDKITPKHHPVAKERFKLYVNALFQVAITFNSNFQIIQMIPENYKRGWGRHRLKWETENIEKVAGMVREKSDEYFFRLNLIQDLPQRAPFDRLNNICPAPIEVSALWEFYISKEGEEYRNKLKLFTANEGSFADIQKFSNIKELQLSFNSHKFPIDYATLLTLPKLKNLEFCRNDFTEVPLQITSFVNLNRIDFQQNKLVHFPYFLSTLPKLTVLSLDHNQISEINSGVEKFTNLTQLTLTYNRIKFISSEILSLTNLTTLIVSSNPLESYPEGLRI